MNSILTRERPDLWQRALALATTLTGYEYLPKMPLPDGTIYACGGEPGKRDREFDECPECGHPRCWHSDTTIPWGAECPCCQGGVFKRKKKAVALPEGAMEWLLHEVGHYVAASPDERALPNYGLTDDIAGTVGGFQKIIVPADHRAEREWQAWGFEEIVLSPFGTARLFTPPTQRDGVAFAKAGPMPTFALRHAERGIASARLDVGAWRTLYGEWIAYERTRRGPPSWERVS